MIGKWPRKYENVFNKKRRRKCVGDIFLAIYSRAKSLKKYR